MSKKILAFVLAFALVFSTMTMAFADTTSTISADAQIAANLGVLKGTTGTVDAAYTKTNPTRIQAAIMFLRLKGLEADALAYTGTTNFADAGSMKWAGGKAILAYLKNHPELGWVGGDGGKFDPNSTVTTQQYYKVMLEALGYKQNSATVVGDFTWEGVMAFAATKGLVKNAAVTNFTVDDLAVATVEALKANVKDSNKTLAAALVEAGKINKDAAIAAGLYTDVATTSAVMTGVKAIANNKVEVTFSADVAKAYAENAANYKVVVKGSTTALEVKSAVQESSTTAVLETAVQTAGTAYTMTVGSVSINFAGLAADKVAPKVDKVEGTDTNTVEITFDKMMDIASATDIANYTLNNGATVKAAAISSSKKVVTLTTEGVANNKVYSVKIANVKSADLVAVATVSKSFTGKTDTKAPEIKTLTVSNNERIIVTFSDDHGVDKAAAENVANYSITSGSSALDITGITAKKVNDDDDYYTQVEIATATMESGKAYTLHINNLIDGSVSANKITSALTKDFRGKSADTTAPKVSGTPAGTSDTNVYVAFDETNRLDVASATNAANYSFDNDITVSKAEIVDADHPDSADGKTVRLTVSSMDTGKYYKLTIANVSDEFGNVMATVTKNVKGVAEDVIPPYVKTVSSTSETEVVLTFNEKLDKASAEDATNYVINNSVGAAVKAELSDDKTVVTLTTPSLTAGKSYKITMNNILDLNGNAMSSATASFVSTLTEIDSTRPEVTSVDSPYNNDLRITFDKPVTFIDTNDDGIADAAPSITVTSASGTQGLLMVGNVLEDGYTVEFKTNDANHDGTAAGGADNWTFVDGQEYTITAINNVVDEHNNRYVAPTDSSDQDTFVATSLYNPGPEVSSWEQIDAKTVRVYFDQPVEKLANTYTTVTETASNGLSAHATFNVTVDPNDDENDAGYSTVDFTITSGTMADSKNYGFNFSSIITNYAGSAAVDEDDVVNDDTGAITTNTFTTIDSYVSDDDAPVINDVVAVDNKTIDVTYNEDVLSTALGTYKITDENGASKSIASITRDSDNKNLVIIKLSSAMDSDTVYTLKPVTGAKDIAGNTAETKDVSFDFTGSSVVTQDFITGVKIIDANTITVKTSDDVANGVGKEYTVEQLDANSDAITPVIASVDANGTNSLMIHLGTPMLDNATYRVTVTGYGTYEFTGIAPDGNIDIDGSNQVTFSGWDLDNYVVKVVYNDGAAVHTYTVLPNGSGNFDLTKALGTDDADATNGAELNLSTGDVYNVVITRTTSDLSGTHTTAAYNAADEGTVIFAQQFTK